MQLLAEYFPLLLFFAAYWLRDIYFATGVALVASVVQIAFFRWKRGRVGVLPWITFGVIVVFGGATLLLHDSAFIRWKPTVLYLLFAAILAIARVAFGRNLIASLLKEWTLPEAVWTRLTWSWVAFFVAMAVANWYVAFNFAERTWVVFKVAGGIGLPIAFAVLQVLFIARHLPAERQPEEPTR
jgi:intracellular septation protein